MYKEGVRQKKMMVIVFARTKTWKYLITGEWINKLGYFHDKYLYNRKSEEIIGIHINMTET